MGVSLNAGSVARSPGCVTLSVKIFIFIDISIFIWLDFASYRVGGAPVTALAGRLLIVPVYSARLACFSLYFAHKSQH